MQDEKPGILVVSGVPEHRTLIEELLNGLEVRLEHSCEAAVDHTPYRLVVVHSEQLENVIKHSGDGALKDRLVVLGEPDDAHPHTAFKPGRDDRQLRLFLLNRLAGSRRRSRYNHDRRIYRIMEMLLQLLSDRPVRVQQAAKQYGVSTRTVRRDLELLDALGFSSCYDQQAGGHRLVEPDLSSEQLLHRLLFRLINGISEPVHIINHRFEIIAANSACNFTGSLRLGHSKCYRQLADITEPCSGCPLLKPGSNAACFSNNGTMIRPFLLHTATEPLILALQQPEHRNGTGDTAGRLRRIIALLAHDLRSPLHGISHLLELLRNDSGINRLERNSLLDKIENQLAETINRIDDTVLWYQTVNSGNSNPEPVNLQQLLIRLIKRHNRCNRLDISLIGDKAVLTISKAAVERLFDNLLDNAVKYAEKSVTIKTAVKSNWVETTLENSCAETVPDAGRRLGLTLVNDLVKEMHGTLRVENRLPNRRFRVTVVLPVEAPPV